MNIFKRTKRFLNRLNYSRKFSLIGLILMIPLIVMNMLYIDTLKTNMTETEQRLEGANYNLMMKDILQGTQQARGFNVKIIGGDLSAQSSLDKVNEKVNNSFGKLAEESRSSAAQIAELIHVVQADTSKSVEMMSQVSENVAVGIDVTKDASVKLNEILVGMEVINPQMAEISATAAEISMQAGNVAQSMQKVVESSQQTSAATEKIATSSEEQSAIMEEVAASADSLADMAESLKDLVKNFKL